MKVAIIGGVGKMGQWFANLLARDGKEIIIADSQRERLPEIGRKLGVATSVTNVEAVQNADYVLLCVPIGDFTKVVSEVGPCLKAGQALLDVTSVKVAPVADMHRYVKEATVLGAHPLFGPGAPGADKQNFVLTPTCDTEDNLARKIQGYLETKGARVVLMSPEEHDEAMSLVLGLSHFIAIVSADTILGSSAAKSIGILSSTTYKVLLTMIQSVLSEDPELYASLQMSLPQAADHEKVFQGKAADWAELVRKKNKAEFIRRMKGLKTQMDEVAPDFGKAYEKMYRIVEGL
jgi:prephenate dehydrogenase